MSVGFLGRKPCVGRVFGSDDKVDVVARKKGKRKKEKEKESVDARRKRNQSKGNVEDSRGSQAVSYGRNEGVRVGRKVDSSLMSREGEERSDQPRVLTKSETETSKY